LSSSLIDNKICTSTIEIKLLYYEISVVYIILNIYKMKLLIIVLLHILTIGCYCQTTTNPSINSNNSAGNCQNGMIWVAFLQQCISPTQSSQGASISIPGQGTGTQGTGGSSNGAGIGIQGQGISFPATSNRNSFSPSTAQNTQNTNGVGTTNSAQTLWNPSTASILGSVQQNLRSAGIGSVISSDGQSLATSGQTGPTFVSPQSLGSAIGNMSSIPFPTTSSGWTGTKGFTIPSSSGSSSSASVIGGSSTAFGGAGQSAIAFGNSVTATGSS
jgi:hypothetical protein